MASPQSPLIGGCCALPATTFTRTDRARSCCEPQGVTPPSASAAIRIAANCGTPLTTWPDRRPRHGTRGMSPPPSRAPAGPATWCIPVPSAAGPGRSNCRPERTLPGVCAPAATARADARRTESRRTRSIRRQLCSIVFRLSTQTPCRLSTIRVAHPPRERSPVRPATRFTPPAPPLRPREARHPPFPCLSGWLARRSVPIVMASRHPGVSSTITGQTATLTQSRSEGRSRYPRRAG